MADVQDDLHAELGWNLRALAAADLFTDERAERGGVAGPLVIGVALVHLRAHSRLCVTQMGGHPINDGYGQMIKAG